MSLTPLLIITLYALAIVTAGLVGSTRRLGFWLTLVVSLFLTPLVGFIVAVLTGRRAWPGRKRHLDNQRQLLAQSPASTPAPAPTPALTPAPTPALAPSRHD